MNTDQQIDTLLGITDLPAAKGDKGAPSTDEQIDLLLKAAPEALGKAPGEPFKLDPAKDWDGIRQLVDAAVFGNYSKSDPKLTKAKAAWEKANGPAAAAADTLGHVAPAIALSTVVGQIASRGAGALGAGELGEFLTGTSGGNMLMRALSSAVSGAWQGALSAGYGRAMGQPESIAGGAVAGAPMGVLGNLVFSPLESSISPQVAQLVRDYARQGVKVRLAQIPGAPQAVSAWTRILGMGKGELPQLTKRLMASTGSSEEAITPEALQDARDAIKQRLAQSVHPAWATAPDTEVPGRLQTALTTVPTTLGPAELKALRLAQNQWQNINVLSTPNLADETGVVNPARLATAVRARAYGGVDPSQAAAAAANPVDIGILARGAQTFQRPGSIIAEHPYAAIAGATGGPELVEQAMHVLHPYLPHLPLMIAAGGAYAGAGALMNNPLYMNLLLRGGLGPVGNPLVPIAQQLYGNEVAPMAKALSPISPAYGARASAAPDDYTRRLFQVESDNNPNAVTGSNYGLGQFSRDQFGQYGITDWRDPDQQATAVARERAAHSALFQNRFGRDPSPGELYLMHQQGQAGGPALIAGGDTPAWQVLRPFYGSDSKAKRAISGNLPDGSGLDANATARQFSQYWISRFESGLPPAGVQVAPGPTSTGFANVLQQPTQDQTGNVLAGSQ